ncbi:hypothetical protein [Janthinobacterium sp. MDT1-19]|uniref:hypothetical protein n=1 Tax=Janthinobacterium sp. MDT1-19 TaxID=1259339 RepID=UPI003F2735BA
MPIIASSGNEIAVFPFKKYDIVSDQYIVSRRYATAALIDHIHGVRCGPSITVPSDAVDGDGLTELDYKPT